MPKKLAGSRLKPSSSKLSALQASDEIPSESDEEEFVDNTQSKRVSYNAAKKAPTRVRGPTVADLYAMLNEKEKQKEKQKQEQKLEREKRRAELKERITKKEQKLEELEKKISELTNQTTTQKKEIADQLTNQTTKLVDEKITTLQAQQKNLINQVAKQIKSGGLNF